LEEEKALFSGDHVMGWSTTVIAPPDGDMAAYFTSLERLLPRPDARYYPTHGEPIDDPQTFVRLLLQHRTAREDQILACLRLGLNTLQAMVPVIYAEVDRRLHPAAAQSTRAHLAKLAQEGRVTKAGETYRLNRT
jgi:glyoxylase-like metal-dependent hydrolase (beta-lactamase superfamily II)